MSDYGQYAPATLRNREFILEVLREVVPMQGVISKSQAGRASTSSISREISLVSISNLPIRTDVTGRGGRSHPGSGYALTRPICA
jgi:hypothetical protein